MHIPEHLKKLRTHLFYYLLPCILLVAFLLWFFILLLMPAGNGQRVYGLTVNKGAALSLVATELEQRKIIRSALHLRILAQFKGQDRSIQAGDYRMTDLMTPAEILEKMVLGDTDARRFTLPEGYSIFQAAELLEKAEIFKKDDFLAACQDDVLLKSLAIPGSSVEGYLFPGTYLVGFKADEQTLISDMVQTLKRKSKSLLATIENSGFNLHQVLTLASIVEREAVAVDEMPLISSVFHNRLKAGMPLQSDPTAIYGVRIFGGTVTRKDVRRETPYNTYRIKGLPPGPIGNPGLDAIHAVLNPAETEYFYFVSRKDGTHQFSRTLKEHNQGVQRFLRTKKTRKTPAHHGK